MDEPIKIEYPKFVFGAEGAKKVNSAKEHKELGAGWYESPALVPKPEQKKEKVEK